MCKKEAKGSTSIIVFRHNHHDDHKLRYSFKMGQVQTSPRDSQTAPAPPSSSSPSLHSLISEAAAYSAQDDTLQNESLEVKAEKALECPCIAHLRTGPCGAQFSNAFLCFLKSTSQEKGSDCVNPFVALQSCIKTNPNAFSKDDLEGTEGKEVMEKPFRSYTIIPPVWSDESKTPKPKL